MIYLRVLSRFKNMHNLHKGFIMEPSKVKAFETKGAKLPLEETIIQRRALLPHDVGIEILYCGICHSALRDQISAVLQKPKRC